MVPVQRMQGIEKVNLVRAFSGTYDLSLLLTLYAAVEKYDRAALK